MPNIGPSLPPDLVLERKRKRHDAAEQADTSDQTPPSVKKPVASTREALACPESAQDKNSDSEEDIGPLMADVEDFRYSIGQGKLPQSSDPGKLPQRQAWMLAPPRPDEWMNNIDTTKLKSRTFAVSRPSRSSILDKPDHGSEARSREARKDPAQSLYEQHNTNRKQAPQDQDDVSKRPFDREQDIERKISFKRTRQIASNAQDFASKFDTGKFS